MKYMNKSIFSTILMLLCVIPATAQRYTEERLYDVVGLADGDEIVDALAVGIPVILIGFLIAYFFMWRNPGNTSDFDGKIGCFGIILMGIVFFLLLPLWAWVEAIGILIVEILFGLAIVIGIIAFIFGKFKS